MNNSYDIIVIGAGCGGLAAAAVAAKAGKSVLLLEKHNVPGGFATSFVRGRFEFEAALHELCGMGSLSDEGGTRALFDSLGITDRIQWTDVPEAFRLIAKGRDGNKLDVTMPFGVSEFINKTEEYVPGSRPSMERLFALADEIAEATEFSSSMGKPGVSAVITVLKKYMNFVRTAPYSVNEVLDALGVPQKAQDIFCAYWSYLGMPCDELSFIHYSSMVRSYLRAGACVPRYRSHEMSMALARCVTENGGTVRYKSEVSKILTDNGSVCGVKLTDGTEFRSSRVIANISPDVLYAGMINPEVIPEDCIKLCNARKLGVRGACMYLALDRSPEELGIRDYSLFYYDTTDTRAQWQLMGDLHKNNMQATVCLNMADTGCSPQGTTLMYFTTLYSQDCFRDVTPESYKSYKEFIAKRFLDNYEYATGIKIREHIEEIEVATPLTFARYSGAPEGAIYGYLAEGWDGVVARAIARKSEKNVPGLRFCGGWGHMLSGMSSALSSGKAAAEDTLSDMNTEVSDNG